MGHGKRAALDVSGDVTVQVQAETILRVVTGTLADLGVPFDGGNVRQVVSSHLRAVGSPGGGGHDDR